MTHVEAFINILERMRRLPMGPAFQRLIDMGLSPTHIRTLGLLYNTPSIPMKDLAEQLEIRPPSVTAIIRRLVKHKLVERHPDRDDSRKVLLKLSTDGTALFTAIQTAHHERIAHLLSGLNTHEQAQLIDLMGRAVGALESSGGSAWNE